MKAALLAMLVVLLAAGLYPFNFFPHNEVTWQTGHNGIRFEGYGQVYGSSLHDPFRRPDSAEFSLEFLVGSSEGRKRSVERLFSFQQLKGDKHFAIERWTEDLVVAGWVRNAQGKISFQRFFCGHVFASREIRFITVTSGPADIRVYIEGIQQRHYAGSAFVPGNFVGPLLLGQSSSGHQEWRGEIAGLAIYNKALSAREVMDDHSLWRQGKVKELRDRASEAAIYPFDERTGDVVHNRGNMGGNLKIPEEFRALRRAILKTPDQNHFANRSDIILNVMGFVPFSALVAIYLEREGGRSRYKAAMISIVISVLISLSIELLQVYLPSRDSSLLDLLMNALGSGIGATFGVLLSPRLTQRL